MSLRQLTDGKERDTEENGYFEGHRRSSTMMEDAEMFEVQDIYRGSRPLRRRKRMRDWAEGEGELSCRPYNLQPTTCGALEQMLLIRVILLSGQNGLPHCIQADPGRKWSWMKQLCTAEADLEGDGNWRSLLRGELGRGISLLIRVLATIQFWARRLLTVWTRYHERGFRP